MVQRVPTAGRCPSRAFGIVTRSLACFCGALGCCVKSSQRWHYLLSSAPVPSYTMLGILLRTPARNALHSMHTKSLKLQPSSSSSAKGHAAKHEEHARSHEDLLAPWVAFNAEAMHQPHVRCPCSNLSTCCDPFSSKTFSVKNQARTGKKSRPLLHLLLLMCMNCQDDHNTTLHSATSSSLTPMSWETLLPSQLFKLKSLQADSCS